MNNIAKHLPMAEFSSRQNNSPDLYSANIAREHSVSTRENLDTGLVIETRDGDRVTINSNSFTRMDAYMYDARGVMVSDGVTAAYSHSQREITLASGQSFSFSVQGDLSEEEMEDIESILQGFDGVIAEMKEGDMAGALDQALGMGGHGTVSSFSAEISYQRSYQMTSAVSASTTQVGPFTEEGGREQKELPAQAADPAKENQAARLERDSGMPDFDKFIQKMLRQLEGHDKKQIALAKDPIDRLFGHHLEQFEKNEDDPVNRIFNVLENAMNMIDSIIDEMLGKASAVEGDLQAAEDGEVESEGDEH